MAKILLVGNVGWCDAVQDALRSSGLGDHDYLTATDMLTVQRLCRRHRIRVVVFENRQWGMEAISFALAPQLFQNERELDRIVVTNEESLPRFPYTLLTPCPSSLRDGFDHLAGLVKDSVVNGGGTDGNLVLAAH